MCSLSSGVDTVEPQMKMNLAHFSCHRPILMKRKSICLIFIWITVEDLWLSVMAFVNQHWRLYQNCLLCRRVLSRPSETARRCMLQPNKSRQNTAIDLPRYSPSCRLCMLNRNNLLRFRFLRQELISYHYSSCCCCCCSSSSSSWGIVFRNA